MKAYTPTNWVRRKTWIGIVLIAIGVLVSMVSAGRKTAPTNTETTTIHILKPVTEKRWVYTFSKPEGVQGLDSRLRDNRSIPCYAKITAYDGNRFDWELIMPSIGHKAYYFWLKRRQPQGEWERDDNSNHGAWSLMPDEVSDGQPISFWGWETNLKGEKMFIRLRAID